MSNIERRNVTRPEAQLVYFAVARALQIQLDMDEIRRLAELTRDVADVTLVVDRLREHKTSGADHRAVPSIAQALTARRESSGNA